MNGWVVFAATVALIALSAFFVVIEFSLLGARRHRLEEQATTSRSARAALKGVNELTMMLAVAQLGITACTFALGAVTKPAVDAWLGPLFTSWGLVEWASDATAFALSLLLVTFLHLVVGEMAPKSWAIAHPELSARIIGIPSRFFVNVFRPLLRWVNAIANRLVAATGVEPVDRAAVGGQDADTIRQLVEHSAKAGVLEPEFRRQISGIIDLQSLMVESLVSADTPPTSVPASATVAEAQEVAMASGHLRILLEAESGAPEVVHVRDTLLASAESPAAATARPAYVIAAGTPVYEVMSRMREASVQLAVVMDGERMLGVVTLADVLRRVLPQSV